MNHAIALQRPRPATGVSRGVSGALRAPGSRVSTKCPENVPGVSKTCPGHSGDTLGTLFGHSGARGPKSPRDTPRDSCSRPGGLQRSHYIKTSISEFTFAMDSFLPVPREGCGRGRMDYMKGIPRDVFFPVVYCCVKAASNQMSQDSGAHSGRYKIIAFRAGKKTKTRKHINISRDCPGIIPGLSRHVRETSWGFCLCVSLFAQEKGNTYRNLSPIHSRDNAENLFMFIVFCVPRSLCNVIVI